MSSSPLTPAHSASAALAPTDEAAVARTIELTERGELPAPARARLAALLALTPTPHAQPLRPGDAPSKLTEVAAYLGATLVFAAAVTFTFLSFEDLGRTGTGMVILALTTILGLLALLAQRGLTPLERERDELSGTPAIRRRLSQLAGLAATVTLGVGVGMISGLEDETVVFLGASITAVAALVVYRLLRSAESGAQVISFVALCAAAMSAASSLFEEGSFIGAPIIAVSLLWLGLLAVRVVQDRASAVLLAGLGVLIGAQVSRFDGDLLGLVFLILAVLAAASFLTYARTQIPGMLGLAVLTTTLLIPQLVAEFTDGALGAAGGLLVGGLTLLGASFLGLRLRETPESLSEPSPAEAPQG